ncbi:MAG: DeoR/GlpR transcriptional regulator [Anaerolineaceae bacterium]|nr:DeoR/GlpR transcriptional regulator [Anaerolineaceae bacterium]
MTIHSLSSTERHKEIVEMIERNKRVSVLDICERFAISEATARRDLEFMDEHDMIQRVYGGAIALDSPSLEVPIIDRQDMNCEQKRLIGLEAAKLINNGETIFLGSGTTVLEVARALVNHKNLTVITNSLPILNTLSKTDNNIIGLGGELRSSELSFIGHITEQSISEFRADKVIIGTPAISLEHGLTHEFMPETMTDRAVLKISSNVIVVADFSKFERVATSFLAPIEKINTIVTDNNLELQLVEAIEQRGVTVICSIVKSAK